MKPQQNKNALIAATARKIVEDRLDPIEGVRAICALRFSTEIPDHEAFIPLRGIESETDHFVLGTVREIYSTDYLMQIDNEKKIYLDAAMKDILNACRRIIKIFS